VTDAHLEPIPYEDCLELLRQGAVGRIAVVNDGAPLLFPVNFRLVETGGVTWVAIRTRPGNVIDRSNELVAFEIDGIDPYHSEGWSVLVQGTIHHVDPEAADFRVRFDSHPWLEAERDAWLVIQPFSIEGRRLHAEVPEWAFHVRGYL
jgi:nitroimidazol reductase NimA-like FMN-containing flavoprotein (pyridoxamine 5'-phosphate oxidase superfamily)